MVSSGVKYDFNSVCWQHSATGGWYFISLPQDLSIEIRELFGKHEEGWGRLKASAKIGSSEWKTSIWFDTKRNTYVLPLKAEIRKKERIELEDEVVASVWV